MSLFRTSFTAGHVIGHKKLLLFVVDRASFVSAVSAAAWTYEEARNELQLPNFPANLEGRAGDGSASQIRVLWLS